MATKDRGSSSGNDGNPRIMMWCVSRSVSTAVTKCLSFVDGAEVWLEPYNMAKAAEDRYAWCGKEGSFPLELEGNEDIYREAAEALTLGGDLSKYRLELLSPAHLKSTFDSISPEKKFVFIKDMAVGLSPSRYKYLPDKSSGFKYFFLIRNPIKSYLSYRKILLKFMDSVSPDELPDDYEQPNFETFHFINDFPPATDGTSFFFEALHSLWKHVRATYDEDPIIVDIDDLLEDPAAMMPRLCNGLGIPYSDSLLSWDASADVLLKWNNVLPNVRDSPRYSMFFTTAAKSTCFKKTETKASLDEATPDVKEAVEKEMPYYEEMYKHRLTL